MSPTAGPKMDIVQPLLLPDGSEQPTGFLATSVEEYADAITRVRGTGVTYVLTVFTWTWRCNNWHVKLLSNTQTQ